MINTVQAVQLKELIEAYRTATESHAFKGSQPPDEWREIELDLYNAKRQLDAFVDSITAPTDSIAVPTTLRQAKAMMAVASMFLEEHAPKPAPQPEPPSSARTSPCPTAYNIGKVDGRLPPDPDDQNNDRATWAANAVRAFADITCMDTAGEDDKTILVDLLTDLMHWCDRQDIDFATVLDCSLGHYIEETK